MSWRQILRKLIGVRREIVDRLQLNSLERFTKHSERLLLEQYGSCEVPAGCGGAVLRWRNPQDGLPMIFSAVINANGKVWIDGRPLVGSCLIVPPGDHVLAAHFTKVKSKTRPLVFTALDNSAAKHFADREYLLKSAADGTWLATTSQPAEDWMMWNYDDSDWNALEEVDGFDLESLASNWKWRYERKVEDGAVPLAVPAAEQIWIRKRFHLAVGE